MAQTCKPVKPHAPQPDAPADETIEQALLGGILTTPAACAPVLDGLSSSDFYIEQHRLIFGAMAACRTAGDPPDLVLVSQRLQQTGNLDFCGGGAYLTRIMEHCPTSAHVPIYARQLRELASKRALIAIGSEAQQLGLNGHSAAEGASLVLGQLQALLERARPTTTTLPTASAAELYERLGSIQWLWPDHLPVGFLSLLVGPPGAGKSALALALAGCVTHGLPWPDGAAAPEPGPVLWVDCESSIHGTVERAQQWNIGSPALRVVDETTDFLLDEEDGLERVLATARSEGARLIVIDSLAGSHRRDEDRAEPMKSLLSLLAAGAARDQIVVLALHHLRKRGVLEGPQPDIDRVRGSSTITALARSCLAVWQPVLADQRRTLACIKTNFSRLPEPLGFSICETGLTFCDPVAAEAPTSARREATDWLRDLLAGGKRRRADVLRLAAAEGFRESTIERARRELGLVTIQDYDAEARVRTSWWGLPG